MWKRLRVCAATVCATLITLALPAGAAGQVNVMISGGFSTAYRELQPEFEKASASSWPPRLAGSVGTGPNAIGSQLRPGCARRRGHPGQGRVGRSSSPRAASWPEPTSTSRGRSSA